MIYLALLTTGAFAAGIATDAIFGWFPSLLPDVFVASGSHGMGGLSAFELVSGALLGVLTLWHLGRQIASKLGKKNKLARGAVVLKVPDMTCQHCARTITGAVCDLPGVREVRADPATKLVSLDLQDDADAHRALQAIEDA